MGFVFGHLSDISDMKSGQKGKQINRELIRKTEMKLLNNLRLPISLDDVL